MQRQKLAAVFFAAVIVLGLAASAGAVDGTIEINQATVIAAGGFPYTIGASGSYRLTGNLNSGNTTGAIYVAPTLGQVTIDLNGFSITGPGAPFGGTGVAGDFATGCTVENGTVTGFGVVGVLTGNNGIVRNVRATSNGVGIDCSGNGCLISDNTVNNNSTGIGCGSGCLISGNTLFNNAFGIQAGDATTGYGGNVLKNTTTNVSGGTSLKNNVCNGVVC
jgi:hypothetical protein